MIMPIVSTFAIVLLSFIPTGALAATEVEEKVRKLERPVHATSSVLYN
jgi:hypothetical protein